MPDPEPVWPVSRLTAQLRDLGVRAGDTLFVHTGLRATRLARHEVPNLLAAYLRAVGDEGAVFFPTHTYCFKSMPGVAPYHLDMPCVPGVGVWPELTRRIPGVTRSLQPTHSNAGIGADVDRILGDHADFEPVGVGSPLDKHYLANDKVLLIGCGFESCTALHLAETYAQVPYLGRFPNPDDSIALTRTSGTVREIPIRERPGCSTGFPKFEPRLRAEDLIRDGRLAEAPVMLCEM
ncbi:MAG: AAC(3) family N-acetyltransferase, partial [Candidatus Hydrogenedentes bacterium]|nr:AAC(3) family N-acetyltransferase [Candidatus Hydrogenedentota bacterium]